MTSRATDLLSGREPAELCRRVRLAPVVVAAVPLVDFVGFTGLVGTLPALLRPLMRVKSMSARRVVALLSPVRDAPRLKHARHSGRC